MKHRSLRNSGDVKHVGDVPGTTAVLRRPRVVILVVAGSDIAVGISVIEAVRIGVICEQRESATEAVLHGSEHAIVIGIAGVVRAEQTREILAILRPLKIEQAALVDVAGRRAGCIATQSGYVD